MFVSVSNLHLIDPTEGINVLHSKVDGVITLLCVSKFGKFFSLNDIWSTTIMSRTKFINWYLGSLKTIRKNQQI